MGQKDNQSGGGKNGTEDNLYRSQRVCGGE